MGSRKIRTAGVGIAAALVFLGNVTRATALCRTVQSSSSGDEVDIDQLAEALNQSLNAIKEAVGDDPGEVAMQVEHASRMLDKVWKLSEDAFQSVGPNPTSRQSIHLPDKLMNWPLPIPKPLEDRVFPVQAFDFTGLDFSVLERSLEFPKVDHPSPKE